jgi:AcrR family transcriptional regulator
LVTVSSTEGRGAGKGELTRSAILAAAIDRFGRDGYRATSVADIAREAGVSGTATYAHFPNKEALFLAAVDEDAAGTITEGLAHLVHEGATVDDWRQGLLFVLLDALERHPLARRLLAGLEPEVTVRVLDMPALEEMRKAVAERLRADQAIGRVRPDIDPPLVADGIVAIVLSLLMSVVQLGPGAATAYAGAVTAVFAAAVEPTALTREAPDPPAR